jgi:hypothetical protein
LICNQKTALLVQVYDILCNSRFVYLFPIQNFFAVCDGRECNDCDESASFVFRNFRLLSWLSCAIGLKEINIIGDLDSDDVVSSYGVVTTISNLQSPML